MNVIRTGMPNTLLDSERNEKRVVGFASKFLLFSTNNFPKRLETVGGVLGVIRGRETPRYVSVFDLDWRTGSRAQYGYKSVALVGLTREKVIILIIVIITPEMRRRRTRVV